MFHLSRAIVFIACLAAAVFVNWQTGLIGLLLGVFVTAVPARRVK
jgi:hypothetical protein